MEGTREECERAFERELAVSFTGHRAAKLPWGYDERDERCLAFKAKLEAEIIRAYRQGARYFLSGMADGVDLYAAESVLKLSHSFPEMKLVAVFPFGRGDTERKRRCADRAYRVVSVCGEYAPYAYMARNEYLVRHSSRIICGFTGEAASGTGATIRLASREGIDIVILSI
ncbi:MAG: DUF1273 family protein [Clostridia bacterium]|nr:DUF1273 family protein [Clostridia bacterium]